MPPRLSRFVFLALAAVVSILAGPGVASAQFSPPSPSSPEAASGIVAKQLVRARRHLVVAANPLAADAGRDVLREGGSAVDAAIAVQLVLNLVEPQSSGLGGGAFLVHFEAARGAVTTLDGRETAPKSARSDMLLGADGVPLAFPEAVASGLSVGVPGLAPLLETAHRAHGRLPLSRLAAPAIKLAEDGFAISQRLHSVLRGAGPAATFNETARAMFFEPDGAPRPIGSKLVNPAFAATLRAFAQMGARALQSGPVADEIIKAVGSAPARPAEMTREDLANYATIERPAVCAAYRKHRICGMGPPSSGMLAIAQTLAIAEPFDLGTLPLGLDAMHIIAEAQKLAYADREAYVADPRFAIVPAGLLDAAYLDQRRKLIDTSAVMAKAEHGVPPGVVPKRTGVDATVEMAGTSHISIVDGDGNAVALTTTIENAFGSRLMAAGFMLNNQLTDFSFRPVDAAGVAIANAVEPGKRPRSSMSPTIVFGPDGALFAVLGSAGGSRIPLHVTKALVALIDWKLDAQAAADLAHFGSRNGPFEIEPAMAGVLPGLKMAARGHKVDYVSTPSGLHIIVRRADGTLEGGADPRREGEARGD